MKDISQDPFWKGLARVVVVVCVWGGACEFLRLRRAVSTALHTGPTKMEETANSMESAPSPRGHPSMTALETQDSTETSLLNWEVPAPRTGHDTVIAYHKCEPGEWDVRESGILAEEGMEGVGISLALFTD